MGKLKRLPGSDSLYIREWMFGKLRTVSIDKHLKFTGETKRFPRTFAEAEPVAEDIRKILRANRGVYVPPSAPAAAQASTASTDTPPSITVDVLVAKWAKDFKATSGIDTWANDTGQMGKVAALRLDALDLDADDEPEAPADARVGTLTVEAITAPILVAIWASTKPFANSTRKKYRHNLRRLFAFAVARKFLAASPIADLKLAAGKDFERTRRCYPAEESNILGACAECRTAYDGQRLADLIVAAIETGARLGELLALTWADVETADEGEEVVHIRAKRLGARKTRQARIVPIDEAARFLAILTRRRRDPNGRAFAADRFVFGDAIGDYAGHPDKAFATAVLRAHNKAATWTATALSTAARKAFAAIDLEFRDFRHEAAWRWHEAGKPVAAIAKILGHADVGRLATYLGATMDDAIAAFRSAGKSTPKSPATAQNRSKTDQKSRNLKLVRRRRIA